MSLIQLCICNSTQNNPVYLQIALIFILIFKRPPGVQESICPFSEAVLAKTASGGSPKWDKTLINRKHLQTQF